MTIAVTTPVTGAAQTGLTTPGYVITADTPPEMTAKQWAVTSLTGTQTGVRIHASSDPFTFTCFRPKVFQALGKAHPVTGVVKFIPFNRFRLLTRKGVIPLAGQPVTNFFIDTSFSVPAGSDTADAPNVRAACSLHFGVIAQQSAGIGDTLVTGLLG